MREVAPIHEQFNCVSDKHACDNCDYYHDVDTSLLSSYKLDAVVGKEEWGLHLHVNQYMHARVAAIASVSLRRPGQIYHNLGIYAESPISSNGFQASREIPSD